MCAQLQMDCVSGSTQNPPPKPGKLGFDAVDSGSELTHVYTDMVACHVSNLGPSQHHNVSSLYDIILYLAARLCNIPEYMLQLITSLRYCNHSMCQSVLPSSSFVFFCRCLVSRQIPVF